MRKCAVVRVCQRASGPWALDGTGRERRHRRTRRNEAGRPMPPTLWEKGPPRSKIGLRARLPRQVAGLRVVLETVVVVAPIAEGLVVGRPTAAERDHGTATQAVSLTRRVEDLEVVPLQAEGAVPVHGDLGIGHSLSSPGHSRPATCSRVSYRALSVNPGGTVSRGSQAGKGLKRRLAVGLLSLLELDRRFSPSRRR